ncbi:MAG: Gfo/Idh/MocA family oxidoreductase [Actinobacteria bacterium]|nr:Gfo/Idh/MocA family oxidoreductase [Actinomycetota bacterium]
MSDVSANDHIGLAVVGTGYWGPNLVRNAHEIEGTNVRYVCDLRPEPLARIAARFPGVQTTQRFEDVLAADSVDAVVIATPVSTHYPLASAALAAGKHVLVEKPLAASTDEAARLVAEADSRGLVLLPGHTFLYSPPVNMVAELIATGELGEIYFISTSRVNLGLHQTDVSVIWDLAPHDFSILRDWLGEAATSTTAVGRDCILGGMADVAFVGLDFPSGTIAHVELSWLAPAKLRRTTVVGSRSMVIYDDTSPEPVRVYDSGVMLEDPQSFGEYKLTYRTGDIISPRVKPTEPLSLELQDFCNSIRTGATPRSSAVLGLEVVSMIEAAEQSLAEDGRRVPVSEPLALLGNVSG